MEPNTPIKNKFLYFKTQEAFDDAYRNGNITDDHIVVICDLTTTEDGRKIEQTTAKIYAHGKWISGTVTSDTVSPQTIIQVLYDNGFDKKMKWS